MKNLSRVSTSYVILFVIFSSILVVTITNTLQSNIIAIAKQEKNTVMNKITIGTNTTDKIPTTSTTAQSVYQSQSMTVPQSVGIFIWYIVDEAHEDAVNERHKYISDHNPIYLPMNLVIQQGTAISFLDADAPWDTPHPHTINIMDSSNNIVYTTGKLDYTNSSTAKVLPVGQYTIQDTKYPWMKGNLSVVSNPQKSVGNLIMGGFYTPTSQVANNKDNDGGIHPGWLGYYKEQFPKNGFKILDTFNFHYATCKYCPGGFWPDQKTGDHTLIVYSTNQPLKQALNKLGKLVWENVYI
ncbi:MAG: hypothetical protein ACTHKP_01270 [Nitrososphaeraceae archaeon]